MLACRRILLKESRALYGRPTDVPGIGEHKLFVQHARVLTPHWPQGFQSFNENVKLWMFFGENETLPHLQSGQLAGCQFVAHSHNTADPPGNDAYYSAENSHPAGAAVFNIHLASTATRKMRKSGVAH